MKKFAISLLSFLLLFSLAACSQKADPVDSKTKEKESLTLEEVFTKTTTASKSLKSVHSDMELKQTMSVPDQQSPMDIQSTISVDMVLNPMAMHQNMKMNVTGGDDSIENQAMNTESYLAKEGFFFKDPTSKQWMQMPGELSKQVLQMPQQQANPVEQLKQLQQFVDDFSFKQNDTQYILKLKASGEKFNQFLKENTEKLLPDALKQNADVLQNIKFKNVDYEIFIDKKTFNIAVLNTNQEMEMAIQGQKLNLKQEMKSTYSNYNKLGEIKVPQEVLDNAKKVQ
ncbi:hypothetical protein JK635_01060 [Neobacillus sp. YIM B02564]|jgi:hypothetical protein|uniref:Lipoprotein n=1 Tax=Neobacillus paridis TaxID=2803862 RepID=A0ABS1TJZ7_9BACI|nr:DUF6612 family protein [Neobacillus paridis]MBL4950833.1 hypothetical protein [Neobacillus paridis]